MLQCGRRVTLRTVRWSAGATAGTVNRAAGSAPTTEPVVASGPGVPYPAKAMVGVPLAFCTTVGS